MEKGAPDKYRLDSSGHNFSIVKDNVPVELTIENVAMTGNVKLLKVDDYGAKLKGAVFQLYRADNTLVGEYTTDANGEITVTALRLGGYYWIEKTAPSGYELNTKQYSFTIGSDGQTVEVKAVNVKQSIPYTGGPTLTAWIVSGIAGIVGFVGSMLLMNRKPKKDKVAKSNRRKRKG